MPILVSFRGSEKACATPRWSPLGVKFKISDKHPCLIHIGVLPPRWCPLKTFIVNYLQTISSHQLHRRIVEDILYLSQNIVNISCILPHVKVYLPKTLERWGVPSHSSVSFLHV